MKVGIKEQQSHQKGENVVSQSKNSYHEILETFAEFNPIYTLPVPTKFISNGHPVAGAAFPGGYVDPRFFHGLENGYGMIAYPPPFAGPIESYPPMQGIDLIEKPVDPEGSVSTSVNPAAPPSSSSARPSGPSAAAKERRRERNKVLARKTRQKKKVETENLRDQLVSLKAENERLKSVIRDHLPSVTISELLQNDIQLPEVIRKLINQMIHQEEKLNWQEIIQQQRSFVVVNPNATDAPIVYASPGFLELTGYSREECVGRNCRFLQGPETDLTEVAKLKEAILQEREISAVLINYHKDGSPFWNRLELQPLRDESGTVRFIVGVQNKMDDLSIRVRLARQRNHYNLRSRKSVSSLSSQSDLSVTKDANASKSTPPTPPAVNSQSPSKQNSGKDSPNLSNINATKSVSKALESNSTVIGRDLHLDKRIRLSLLREGEEKKFQNTKEMTDSKSDSSSPAYQQENENSSGNSPSTDDSQRQGEGNTTADDLTIGSSIKLREKMSRGDSIRRTDG